MENQEINNEENLTDTERYYQTLIEKAQDGIVLIDKNNKISYASPTAKRMFGYDADFIDFPDPDEFTHPEDLPIVLDTLAIIMNNPKRILTIEYRFKNKTGKYLWIESTFRNYLSEPSIESIIINFRDINDRKNAEIALIESKKHLHRMISNLPGFIYICKYDEHFTMEFISEGCTNITGYTPNDFINNHTLAFSDILLPDELPKIREMWDNAIKEKILFENEHRIKRADGEIRWIWERGNCVFGEDGNLQQLEGFISDITERKRVEEKLNETYSLMKIADRKAKLGGWTVDLINRKCDWSDEVALLHGLPVGYTPKIEEAINFYAPEWRDRITKVFNDCAKYGIAYDEEMEIISANNTRVWARTMGEAVRDSDGKIIKLIGAFQDITKQKEVEQKIREKDLEFRKLTSNLKDMIFQMIRRPDGTYYIPIASEGITHIFGCKSEDVVYNLKTISDVIYNEDIEHIMKEIDYSANNMTYLNCEFRVQLKDQPIQWIVSRAYPEKLPDGSITWYGYNSNITESKNTEKALIESEKKYRQLFQYLTKGFALHEIILDENGKPIDYIFLEVNSYFEKLTGLKAENLIGKSILEVLPGTEHYWIDIYGKVALTGESLEFQNYSVVFQKYYQVTVYSPEPMKFATIFLDITEQKEAEILLTEQNRQLEMQYEEYTKLNELLLKTNKELEFTIEKAKESDRLKSAFLANMSHEIRTPMNGILGFTELLKDPKITGEEQKEFLEIMQKSGNRMLNIINDLVDISKIESGTVEIKNQVTNINEQLDFIYNFFKPQAEKKNIALSINITLSDEESTINTDSEKFIAIMTNLVRNAIKFTYFGSITIGYDIKDYENEKFIEFFVKDTGIGIPDNRKNAIFERFVQADIEDRNAFQGAGLGLAITKSYVELMGGKIWVKGKEGLGSTFYFTIPYHLIKKENQIMEEKIENLDEKKLNVLIAEDDETSSILISIALKPISKEIFKVRTGVDAVEVCRNNPDIQLILMDIKMPLLNGYEATKRIREFNKDVIIIAQTAYGMTGDREKAIESGCNDYISKPIVLDKLISIISKYFK